MRITTLSLALLLSSLLGAVPAVANECTCRYKGSDVAEGKTICMRTSNGSQMAQCTKVLNNTSWKFLGTPCPTANNQPNTSNAG